MTATDIFRKIEWIKDCVKILKTNKNFDSVFSGHKTHKNFWIYENKWMRVKPFMKFYASRQIKKSGLEKIQG